MIVKKSNGLAFEVRCVNCTHPVKLNYSRNATTGKISFSFYNYTRHYEKHNESIPPNQQNSLQVQASLELDCNETQYTEFMQITQCEKNTSVVTSTPTATPKTVPAIFGNRGFVQRSNETHQKDILMLDSQLQLKADQKSDELESNECKECHGLKMQVQECMDSFADCKNQLNISYENAEKMKINLEKKGKKP